MILLHLLCVKQKYAVSAALDPDEGFIACEGSPLEALRALLEESRIDLPEDLPPMASGVFGFMGYDMVRLMEHLPDQNPDALGLQLPAIVDDA